MKYNKRPKIKFKDKIHNFINYQGFISENESYIIETYPGVDIEEIIARIKKAGFKGNIMHTDDYSDYSAEDFRTDIKEDLTEDRVFGKFTNKTYEQYYNLDEIKKKVKEIRNHTVPVLVIGICAYLFSSIKAKIIYADALRWTLQLRYRENQGVFFKGANEKDKLKNFKRGYFIEWRMADKIKLKLWDKIHFYLDTENPSFHKIISGEDIRKYTSQAGKRPFRLVPYFDAGVWGGKWMMKNFDLGTNKHSRWAWGFDGVPEENSVILSFDSIDIEMPAINIVLFSAKDLLGERVWSRFGSEYPIRFDFLDTIGGENLSLQVHPTAGYMWKTFRTMYTQDESYYFLDVDKKSNPCAFLGVKNDFDLNKFIDALNNAQKTNSFVNIEDFVNKIPVKKHDHLLIPAGVVQAAGVGTLILEISATPYIFTFKLWDWGRVGLDGLPRPINIEHGKNVIIKSFNTERTMKELVNNFTLVEKTDNYIEEKTGLHENQFIETRRFKILNDKGVVISTNNSVNQLNLVEGSKVIVESIDDSFPTIEIGYAETFIVPEICKKYRIRPAKNSLNKNVMILQAFVRT